MIDALTVCFEVTDRYHYDRISELEYGDIYDLYEFQLIRVEGRYYDNVYTIIYKDGDNEVEFGQLKFNLGKMANPSNLHSNGSPKIWISLNNRSLQTNDQYNLGFIATKLGLEPHNVTTLDLCLDTPYNVSKPLRQLIKNKAVTTILNGTKVKDRDEDRPEITYTLSGSLNKDKYMTVNVKQRNAIKDKSRGVTVTTYDKLAEISNSSGKEYILNFYGNPTKLFRTEVHLNNTEIKDYLDSHGLYFNYYMIDEALLEDMFFYHLNSVIRFKYGKQDIMWEQLLGRASQGYNNPLSQDTVFRYKLLIIITSVSNLKRINIIN